MHSLDKDALLLRVCFDSDCPENTLEDQDSLGHVWFGVSYESSYFT